jgi:cullin-4
LDLPASYEEVLEACSVLIEPPFSRGDVLHSEVRLSLEKFSRESCDGLTSPKNTNNGVRWLQDFVDNWEWYHSRLSLLRSILLDLDRVYLLDNSLESILDAGLAAWKRFVTGKGAIDHRIVGAIEEWSRLERDARVEHASRKDIKRLIKALSCLNSYSVFQIPLLAETTKFYVEEAGRLHASMDPVDFLVYAERRVNEEETRCREVLPEPGRIGVISQTEKCLWGTETQVTWIAEHALPRLLKEKDTNGIVRMHELFSRVKALPLMRSNFKKFASQIVHSIVQTPTGGDENMVQLLLDVKKFLDQVVVRLEDKELGYANTTAFESSFTSRSRKPAELIAKFIDIQLRTGQKLSSDEEHMSTLKTVLELYRFTPGQLFTLKCCNNVISLPSR